MKKLFLTGMFFLISFSLAFAAKDPLIEDVKDKSQTIIGKSELFKIERAEYDKRPSVKEGTNVYMLTLKAIKNLGDGTFTLVKYPNPTSQNEKKEEIAPQYQTVTIKVLKYIDKTKSMEKEVNIQLHLVDPENIAVYQSQIINLIWSGDGAWGAKGFQLYAYIEKVVK